MLGRGSCSRLLVSCNRLQVSDCTLIPKHRQSCRTFYNPIGTFLRYKANYIDENRLKYMGPDRPAAEWILMNKGKVKMIDGGLESDWITSYREFPHDNLSGDFRLLHIKADNCEVTAAGFRHIKNIETIKSASFGGCRYVNDAALPHLWGSAGSLEVLNLRNTGITPACAPLLARLGRLKRLDLSECKYLPVVHRSEGERVIAFLEERLPNCRIVSKFKRIEKNNNG